MTPNQQLMDNHNWAEISKCKNPRLDEQFIRDNSNMLYWDLITIHQIVPEDLILTYIDGLHSKAQLRNILKYQVHISEELKTLIHLRLI